MSILINGITIIVVNVYIRSDLGDVHSLNDYLESLIGLETLIESFKFDSIFFVGDFNADPFSGRSYNNLKDFIFRNNLKCFDIDILDENTFTFLSYGNSVTKWLDHIIGRTSGNIYIAKVNK